MPKIAELAVPLLPYSLEARLGQAVDARVRSMLDTDKSVRDYLEGETTVLPDFYRDRIRRELGPFWDYLPEGALEHDPNAYLKASAGLVPIAPRPGRGTAANRGGVATVA